MWNDVECGRMLGECWWHDCGLLWIVFFWRWGAGGMLWHACGMVWNACGMSWNDCGMLVEWSGMLVACLRTSRGGGGMLVDMMVELRGILVECCGMMVDMLVECWRDAGGMLWHAGGMIVE